jgi:hypothetical protein
MEVPDEEAGLRLPEDERLLGVTVISAQGQVAVASGVCRVG